MNRDESLSPHSYTCDDNKRLKLACKLGCTGPSLKNSSNLTYDIALAGYQVNQQITDEIRVLQAMAGNLLNLPIH